MGVRRRTSVPLQALTSDCRRLLSGATMEDFVKEVRAELRRGERRERGVGPELRRAIAELEAHESRIALLEVAPPTEPYLLNRGTGAWHRVLVAGRAPLRE